VAAHGNGMLKRDDGRLTFFSFLNLISDRSVLIGEGIMSAAKLSEVCTFPSSRLHSQTI
jgi:hypothetical protein